MSADLNAPRWDGTPGFYEVWYVTLTDPASGTGVWIRATLLAPVAGAATASLWFLAMPPDGPPVARKVTVPAGELDLDGEPLRFTVPAGRFGERGTRGTIEDVAWELRWAGEGGAYRHVHPLLEGARIAKTVLTLPHADLAISGRVRLRDSELAVADARGGQAHLWGTKHASRWAWLHCNDFPGAPGDFVDGVTVWVPRFGREVGPSTPVVGRFGGQDLLSTAPHRVLANASRPTLTSWTFTAGAGRRRLVADVTAPRDRLAGVTYEDPDGEKAYCYNTEIADLRVQVYEGGELALTHSAPGRAHFEYAQREPVPGVPLLL